MKELDSILAIIGAGPYGLSIAAHARAAGIPYVLFGVPMAFWKDHMLDDVLLRSPAHLTSLSYPSNQHTLPQYMAERGIPPAEREPFSKRLYLEYTTHFQEQVGLTVYPERVTNLQRDGAHFVVKTNDTNVRVKYVVLATGLEPFPVIPPIISEALSSDRYTHTSVVPKLDELNGRRVLVVGGGQSAFEHAIYAAACGAHVTLAQRSSSIYYADIHQRLSRLFISLLSESPRLFYSLPDRLHDPIRRKLLPTTVAPWMQPLINEHQLAVWTGADLARVREAGHGIRAEFHDGRQLEIDYLIAGTGYQVNLKRHPLCADQSLHNHIKTHDGAPHLDAWYQSSIPGLFFAGIMAMHSYGPAYNFVFGVSDQCRTMVDRYLARQAKAHQVIPGIALAHTKKDRV